MEFLTTRREEKAARQAHLERGIRWVVAEESKYGGGIFADFSFATIKALYMLHDCTVCGEMRLFHRWGAKKHLRLYGGTG